LNIGKRVLVIDDDAPIRKFLRVSLETGGYSVSEAEKGADGIRDLIGSRPEIVILDLGLPDISGLEVIKKVREWSKVPIIVLTVREDEESKVMALDAGADDYLTKPFSVPELMARMRAAERHARMPGEEIKSFRSGPLEVDLAGRIVTVSGNEVHLTATEFGILKLLIVHAGKVVTQRQILQEIWGPNSVENTQYLRVYLGHLRKKIESGMEGKRIIITEPGVGYRLLML